MLWLTVTKRIELAEGIIELTLEPTEHVRLPGFSAGAHIDLHLGDDLVRQYSLTRPAESPSAYSIAVAHDANSRGGSAYVHEILKIGQIVGVGGPRNHFPLAKEAREHVFVAGGIGVTPILAMIRHCEARWQNWRLIYVTRSRARCAYYNELATHGEKVRFHHDEETGGPLDIVAAIPQSQLARHIYCCGPQPLMSTVRNAVADWPKANVHFEWFSNNGDGNWNTSEGENQPFEIVLNRSGERLTIPPDKTILEVLRENGVPIASVCLEGICGTCETSVLSGQIDHRDTVLTDNEKASSKTMMVCCSRGRGEIVLDL